MYAKKMENQNREEIILKRKSLNDGMRKSNLTHSSYDGRKSRSTSVYPREGRRKTRERRCGGDKKKEKGTVITKDSSPLSALIALRWR